MTVQNHATFRAPAVTMAAAEILTSLRICTTESDLREWVATTATSRMMLPHATLIPIEQERRDMERRLAGKVRPCLLTPRPEPVSDRHLRYHRRGHRPPLLTEAREAMQAHRMSASMFGRNAVRDPAFVHELEAGRVPRAATTERVRAYIAALSIRSEGER